MVNTILARRVNHIVAKGDNPVWPKGSKSRGFSNQLDEVEAACIYHAQPPVNTQNKDSYNYNPVKIKTSGRVALIDKEFIVG